MKTMSDVKREAGYYWVKYDTIWEIAKYDSAGNWWFEWDPPAVDESEFEQIQEGRILKKHKCDITPTPTAPPAEEALLAAIQQLTQHITNLNGRLDALVEMVEDVRRYQIGSFWATREE
jgi:hypothetical protein